MREKPSFMSNWMASGLIGLVAASKQARNRVLQEEFKALERQYSWPLCRFANDAPSSGLGADNGYLP